MNIVVSDKKKKEYFISIFQLLKTSTSFIHATFSPDFLHIQGMDKSHVCLFDLTLDKDWFHQYVVGQRTQLCFDATIFYSVLCTKGDDQQLVIHKTQDEEAILSIDFVNVVSSTGKKSDYNKFFTIPLVEYEYDEMNIPESEYDADFSLPAKKVTDIMSQLITFGDDLIISCSDDFVDFKTKGTSGEMRVNIPVDDMTSYSVVEGGDISLSYSLMYVSKMCVSNKLSTDIDFSLSNECPMKIKYDLGDSSSLLFYIAPKMAND